jgi:hypothetical protein
MLVTASPPATSSSAPLSACPNATQASLDLPTSGIVDLPPANTTAWENGYWR